MFLPVFQLRTLVIERNCCVAASERHVFILIKLANEHKQVTPRIARVTRLLIIFLNKLAYIRGSLLRVSTEKNATHHEDSHGL